MTDDNTTLSVVDLPDGLLPPPTDWLPAEEHWLPLPGAVGAELDALARAALGDLAAPEAVETAAGSVLLNEGEGGAEVGKVPVVETPPTTPAVGAATTAAAPTDGPKAGRIEVACPNCATTGLIPWDRLDSLFCCAGCWRWFRIGADGRLAAAPAPPSAHGTLRLYSRNGQDRTVRLTPKLLAEKRESLRQQRRLGRLMAWRGGLHTLRPILLALLPLVLVGSLLYGATLWLSKPRVVNLPPELDERAQLFVESWLKADNLTASRLAHPNSRGPTRRWLYDHRPPLDPGKFDRRKASIDVRIVHQDEETAEVESRIDLPGVSKPLVLQQHWECLNGSWFFRPGEPSPKVAEAPAVKRRDR
jgi:hypothetical protein